MSLRRPGYPNPCSTTEEVLFRLKEPPFVTETVPVGLKTEVVKFTELLSKVPPFRDHGVQQFDGVSDALAEQDLAGGGAPPDNGIEAPGVGARASRLSR